MIAGRANIAGAEAEGAPRRPAASSVLTALTQAPLGIAIFDTEMRYLAASERFLTDQGLPGDTPLVGRIHYEVFPQIPARWREVHARALTLGVEERHEADPFVNPKGQIEWIRWSVTPWREADGEIGGLVLYTEQVTTQVEWRMSLEAAESRYRAVFDQVAVGVARVSPTGQFLEINDRFCAICGRGRDELMDLTFQDITHPDDLETDLAEVRALLAGQRSAYSLEKRYLTRTGEVVWVELTVALVRTETGQPDYFLSIIDDITYRKSVEAEQRRYQDHLRLLINELNHRVKNTLATVQSMAAQTLRGETDAGAAYEKLEARLMGLAQVHDVLTRERWHGASLQEVAERALKPFASQATGQVLIRGPEVWLTPGAALTLALVFHELATNAVKYGALSLDKGRVDLAWTYEAEAMKLCVTWAESRGPKVKPPARKGFGSRLIARALTGELHGQADMAFEPTGLVCKLTARLPKPPGEPGPFGDL